ncbi:PAS domain S-box protein [Telmatobacter bradus]|uniref:PAS domain S-box protein n=1 Tax=Telmatobacter bradus TaxID=474953 RepID=UPI003B42E8C0
MDEEVHSGHYKAELEHMNRLYNALSQINQAIVHSDNRQQLFDRICEVAVEMGGFLLAFIGLVNEQTQQVIPAAMYGPHTEYLQQAPMYADERSEGMGPTGQTLRRRRPYICNDFLNDPATSFWHAAAGRHGFRSSCTFPITLNQKACGVFVLYAGETGYFQEKEIQLLEEAAGDLSFALDNFSREEMRRTAEAAARQLAAIVQSSSDAIISSSLDGRIQTWNSGAEKIFGYQAEDVVGRNFSLLVPERNDALRESMLTRIACGESIAHETELLGHNEKRIPVSCTFSPIHDAQGMVSGVSAIVRDISEHNAMLSALRESNGLLQIMIQEAPAGLAMLDREMRILACSKRWKEDRALTGMDIIGRIHQELDPGTPQRWQEEQARALAGETILSSEDCYVRRDGQLRWLSRTLRPWMTGDGQIGGIVLLTEDITKHKKAEDARRRSEEFLQIFVEDAPVALAMFDRDLCYLSANRRWREDGDLGDVPLIGRHRYEVNPQALPHWREADQRALSGETVRMQEEQYEHTDGTTHWLRWEDRPWRDASGRIGGIIVFSEDITEQKRTALALAAASEHTRLLFEQATDPMFLLDDQDQVVEANASFAALLGRPLEQVLGLHPWNWDNDFTTREAVVAHFPSRNNTPLTFEARIRSLDGSIHDVEVGVTPTGWNGERLYYYVMRNIEARKQAEAALRESQARFETVVDSLHEGLMITDMDGHLIRWNPTVTRILGFSLDQYPDFCVNDFLKTICIFDLDGTQVHPDQTPMQRILHGESLQDALYKIRRSQDGAEFLFSFSGAIAAYESGKRMAFVKFQDITERWTAENTLRETREQLMQVQKMEAIGLLAGGVAHDFNNLLGVILGYGEMLEEHMQEDELGSKYVQQILQAQQRATVLTRQLLTFSRKQKPLRESLHLNDVIRGMHEMLQRLIGADVRLQLECAPHLHTILADQGQMEQVLMNLAVNARDAMPRGGTLTLHTENGEISAEQAAMHPPLKPGPCVRLVVTDTGCGMDKATIERIFEPFFTTKEAGRGTGLGLSILYGIVQQSNGLIEVKSEPGSGTTFLLSLPAGSGQKAVCDATPTTKFVAKGSETILLVDDEDTVRTLLASILQTRGYTVLEAANGQAALEVIRDRRPSLDLLISDVIMPKMSGPELAAQGRILSPDLKVIFISGFTDDSLNDETSLGPQTILLQKPFRPEELLTQVRQILDSNEQA